jgi:DivIVA domain-containing protein
MRPEDIAKKAFPVRRSGYDRDLVDAFLRAVAADHQRLMQDQMRMKASAPGGVAYKEFAGELGGVLQKAAESAERIQREAMEEAERMRSEVEQEVRETQAAVERSRAGAETEADQIRREALAEAQHVVETARQETDQLHEMTERETQELLAATQREITERLDAAEARVEQLRVAERALIERLREATALVQDAMAGRHRGGNQADGEELNFAEAPLPSMAPDRLPTWWVKNRNGNASKTA